LAVIRPGVTGPEMPLSSLQLPLTWEVRIGCIHPEGMAVLAPEFHHSKRSVRNVYQTETLIRVRYGETDQMQYVYYGNYAVYYEVARVESLRQLGLSYKELEATGIIMPVLESHSHYLAPALYDELLRIVVSIPEKPSARIRFDYQIFNESGRLIHRGETRLAFINQKTGKPSRPPEAFLKVLEPYF
jgi:acyl-CoA thioester hydrolase